jgi:hypothetical protein
MAQAVITLVRFGVIKHFSAILMYTVKTRPPKAFPNVIAFFGGLYAPLPP